MTAFRLRTANVQAAQEPAVNSTGICQMCAGQAACQLVLCRTDLLLMEPLHCKTCCLVGLVGSLCMFGQVCCHNKSDNACTHGIEVGSSSHQDSHIILSEGQVSMPRQKSDHQ
jgi:hypothetical protein